LKALATYSALILIISLLRFYLDWWDAMRIHGESAKAGLQSALISGALFFYAVTLAISAFAELGDNPIVARRTAVFVLRGLCWFPPLILFFMYFSVRYSARPPDAFYFQAQLVAAAVSVFVALVGKAHIYALTKGR